MNKVKIKIIQLGQLPLNFSIRKLTKWKSNFFEIIGEIDKLSIEHDADGESWEYTDNNIERIIPRTFEGDLLIALTNVPLEYNYYARRLSNNRICLTFYEMEEILKLNNIPNENLVLKILYSFTLIYLENNRNINIMNEIHRYTHHDVRGCLFDMNGIKSDVIYSTNKPSLCESCSQSFIQNRIPINIISDIKAELKHIKKTKYSRLTDLVKMYPVSAMVLSTIFALIIGFSSSLIATLIYEFYIK